MSNYVDQVQVGGTDYPIKVPNGVTYRNPSAMTPSTNPLIRRNDLVQTLSNDEDNPPSSKAVKTVTDGLSAVQVGTVSVEQGYTASIASCRKWGHTGNTRLTLSGASFSSSSSWIKVGTASFYSNDDVTAPIYDGNNGKFYAGAWRIATNGNIYIMPKETITGYCGVNFMYYVP